MQKETQCRHLNHYPRDIYCHSYWNPSCQQGRTKSCAHLHSAATSTFSFAPGVLPLMKVSSARNSMNELAPTHQNYFFLDLKQKFLEIEIYGFSVCLKKPVVSQCSEYCLFSAARLSIKKLIHPFYSIYVSSPIL